MDKQQYMAQRAASRSLGMTREERGLSHHPDGSGTHTCPDCEGAGETIRNNTNPHGFGPDPQCDEPVRCNTCLGTGEIADGVREVLGELRAARHCLRLRFKGANWRYTQARARAMRPIPSLAAFEASVRTAIAYREMIHAELEAAA